MSHGLCDHLTSYGSQVSVRTDHRRSAELLRRWRTTFVGPTRQRAAYAWELRPHAGTIRGRAVAQQYAPSTPPDSLQTRSA